MNGIVYVVCGDIHQFRDWCGYRKLNPHRGEYTPLNLSSPTTFAGRRFRQGDGIVWLEGLRVAMNSPSGQRDFEECRARLLLMLDCAQYDRIHIPEVTHNLRPKTDYDLEIPGYVEPVMEDDPWATETREKETRIKLCPTTLPYLQHKF